VLCALSDTLEYAGGTPQIVVPDNLKSAVTKPNRYEPKINETFDDFASHYGCVVIPARAGRPPLRVKIEVVLIHGGFSAIQSGIQGIHTQESVAA